MFHATDNIGPYTLTRMLGRGAFGEVWLADRATSLFTTKVALKLPIGNSEDLDSVRREAQLWLSANGHPNIVPVLDAEVYNGQIAIASEYVAGGTLEDWISAHGEVLPPVSSAIAVADGILAGLDYLHRIGLTHRDLKPPNVLMQEGIARLTDFGLAGIIHASSHSANITGTPRYMAPEAFSGQYAPASDLWAVGVILYELLSGNHPFPANGLIEQILAVQNNSPVDLPVEVPSQLRMVVSRLLARQAEQRFPSASAVREALKRSAAAMIFQTEQAVAAEQSPTNLPQQLTSFVGRERELQEVKALLNRSRLVTLIGSGGCGKTRLALQVAAHMPDDLPADDGVWLVELASVADPNMVAQAVANVLNITDEADMSPAPRLIDQLKSRKMLLILDNCEHLLDASASVAEAILRQCPFIRILATSRQQLGLSGECAYRVRSLTLPDTTSDRTPELVSRFESVRLFVDRAEQALPGFQATAQNSQAIASVCCRLDGIPLAIELAAARVRSLSVEEVNEKLDQRFRLLTGGSRTALPRQQTLRSLVDWSYDLLDDVERALLCRLAVFSGGWTLEAAEKVCSGELVEDWEALDLLTSLSDKSLVVVEMRGGRTRYRLLETVRYYASERLVERSTDEIWRDRHLDYFVWLSEEAESHLTGPQQVHWFERLDVEHDNLSAALSWATEGARRSEAGLRLCGALLYFWNTRGHIAEGRNWCRLALDQANQGQARTSHYAKAINTAAVLANEQGDLSSAHRLHEEGLRIWRELDDLRGISQSLNGMGLIAMEEGDYESARAFHEEGLSIRRRHGTPWTISQSLINLGVLELEQSHYDRSRTLLEEAVAIRREIGGHKGTAIALGTYAKLLYELGDYQLARAALEESVAIRRELADPFGVADALMGLCDIAFDSADYVEAAAHALEGLSASHKVGGRPYIEKSLVQLADIAAARSDYLRAARLWGAAERLRDDIGQTMAPSAMTRYRTRITAARAENRDDSAFDSAWSEGRDMSADDAIEFALKDG